MRVSLLLLLLPLVAFVAVADAVSCNYARTCINLATTYAPCSPTDAAEFELVRPALQACKDISYFFSEGQSEWPNTPNDKALYCDVQSPCGAIAPYARNVRSDKLCDSFRSYAGTVMTFAYYCSTQPVGSLPGDNGLLASLKSNAVSPKPTPARTKPMDVETPEPIPNDPTPTPTPVVTKTTTTATAPPVRAETPAPTTNDNNADANAKTSSRAVANSASVMLLAVGVAVAGAVAM